MFVNNSRVGLRLAVSASRRHTVRLHAEHCRVNDGSGSLGQSDPVVEFQDVAS